MSSPDTIFEIHDNKDESYRVEPNPEAPPGTGYENGLTLSWSEKGREDVKWRNHFHVTPEAIPSLATALNRIANELRMKERRNGQGS